MKFRHTFIAVLVCFLFSLNIAEAAPSNGKGHQSSHNWHRVWNRFWHVKRHVKFKAPKLFTSNSKAPQAYTAPSPVVTAQSSSHHNEQKDSKPSNSSGNGGIFFPEADHGKHDGKHDYVKAPEISVASGASAIALLTGLLLLLSERARIRRA